MLNTATNDTCKYTKEVLWNMKAEHEAKFTDIAQVIENTVFDKAAAVEPMQLRMNEPRVDAA